MALTDHVHNGVTSYALLAAGCNIELYSSSAMRDIDIRRKLRVDRRLHFGEADTRIVEELGLCQGIARVDIAVVNGSIHGYEIKSERDTLERLPAQIDIYSRALDLVTVVTAPTHVEKVRKMVPQWWGIWTAVQGKEGLRLRSSRKALQNPDVIPFALAQLLWREEALEVLDKYGLANGMRSKPRQELWHRLASGLPLEDLGNIVRDRLRRRGANWRPPASPA
jgi:hypothetical protein